METNALQDLAELAPKNIFFGTSTWTYPGWKGSIYQKTYKSDAAFRQQSLEEYSQYPLFKTVGIDSFFYSPPTIKKLAAYSSLVPDSFRWVQKVWEHITTPVFPSHKRYGSRAGKKNEDFLDPELFTETVLKPNCDKEVVRHLGPFVFQFPTISQSTLAAREFFEKLDVFFAAVPDEFQYATEIRNPRYLCNDYFHVLNSHGVTHCFNHWNYMPPLLQQMKAAAQAGGLTAPFYVARLLTPLGISYQEAVKRFSPYDSLQTPDETMREDALRLIDRAIKRSVSAFVIVNNRAEGNAPGTIKALAGMISSRKQVQPT